MIGSEVITMNFGVGGAPRKYVDSQIASLTNNGQIKGFIVLTQAEYDALPATKETDGVVYLIRG